MTGNLIDNKVRKYQENIAFHANQPQNTTQSQQYVTGMVDTTPSVDVYNDVPNSPKNTDKKKPLLIIASWLGLNTIMDLFNNNCSKDAYEKTLMGRLGRLGDRITNKAKGNNTIVSMKATFDAYKTKAIEYINKKPLLSAMFNTPTKPENQMVKGFMETQHHADLQEAVRTIQKYAEDVPQTFKEAGATKAEIQALKAKYGTNIFGRIKNKSKALAELQLKRAGVEDKAIESILKQPTAIRNGLLQRAKLRHLGFNPKEFKNIANKPEKYSKEILEACKKGGKNAKAIYGRFSFIPGLGLITKRSTNLSMSYNKLISSTKHTSKLGVALAKLPKLVIRGLTFGGGKLNSFLVALGLGTALYNATKAPKEQKVGTAVAGGVEAVSWILSMPLAIKCMHAVGGLQNVGLSKDQLNTYRKALKNFNKDVVAGKFTDEAAYNTALKAVKDLKNVGPQTKFTKFMGGVGKFLGIGLEVPTPFKEATKHLTGGAKLSAIGRNIARQLPRLGKNLVGYPLRFALYAAVFSPIVDKLISSATSAIFGRPYEPEEENKDKKEEVNQQPENQLANQSIQEVVPQETNFVQNKPVDINTLPDDNLIKREVNGDKVMHQPEVRYIPSEKCEIEGIVSPYDKEERTYIPEEVSRVTSSYASDKATVDALIAKADKVEAKALETLNGIY